MAGFAASGCSGSIKPKNRRLISSSVSLTKGTVPISCAFLCSALISGFAGRPPLISNRSPFLRLRE